VAAVIYVFVGAKASGPEITLHKFEIPVTYEEYGEVKTQTVIYYGQYWEEEKSFHTYYEDSGMPDIVFLGEENGNPIWWLQLQLEAGYLMGDPDYADFYADGMPEPKIGYFDEEWNEHNDVTEAELHGIKLIGCEYPEPIENKIVEKGVKLNLLNISVLTVFAFAILLLGIFLVKKEEDVVYQSRDKAALIFNWVIGVVAVPLFWALGSEWEVLEGKTFDIVLSNLMAPITVLGICASVILRRKGKSRQGMLAQFIGPVLFLYLLFANVLFTFGFYLLFLVAGIAIGIILVVRARKREAVTYTVLDRVSMVTNVMLCVVYFLLSLIMLLMASITGTGLYASPVQKFLTHVFAGLIAATPIYCGIALGMSVLLRRKGRSVAGFLIQFAGFIGIVLLILIDSIPWISITIN
jgi:hypothetical protein